jgi:hypothetical protein
MSINLTSFLVRFQVSNDQDTNQIPCIFSNNTVIEMSNSPLNVFGINHISHLDDNIPTIFMNSIFDILYNGEIPNSIDNNDMMELFLNQSLHNDQTSTEKASSDMIKNLGSYTRVQKDDSYFGNDCIICSCPYLEKEGVRKLPCDHFFHKKCIDRWLQEGSVKCPICRKNPFSDEQVSS